MGNIRYRCVHVTEEIGAWYRKEFGNEFSVLEPRKGNGNSDLLSLSLPQSLGEKKPGPPPPDSCVSLMDANYRIACLCALFCLSEVVLPTLSPLGIILLCSAWVPGGRREGKGHRQPEENCKDLG